MWAAPDPACIAASGSSWLARAGRVDEWGRQAAEEAMTGAELIDRGSKKVDDDSRKLRPGECRITRVIGYGSDPFSGYAGEDFEPLEFEPLPTERPSSETGRA
jgi:hypothetical protein